MAGGGVGLAHGVDNLVKLYQTHLYNQPYNRRLQMDQDKLDRERAYLEGRYGEGSADAPADLDIGNLRTPNSTMPTTPQESGYGTPMPMPASGPAMGPGPPGAVPVQTSALPRTTAGMIANPSAYTADAGINALRPTMPGATATMPNPGMTGPGTAPLTGPGGPPPTALPAAEAGAPPLARPPVPLRGEAPYVPSNNVTELYKRAGQEARAQAQFSIGMRANMDYYNGIEKAILDTRERKDNAIREAQQAKANGEDPAKLAELDAKAAHESEYFLHLNEMLGKQRDVLMNQVQTLPEAKDRLEKWLHPDTTPGDRALMTEELVHQGRRGRTGATASTPYPQRRNNGGGGRRNTPGGGATPKRNSDEGGTSGGAQDTLL